MDQCIAVTNVPARSLPDAWVGGKPSLEEENTILLAEAAHDLRNPLTGITGVAHVLRRRLERDGEVDQAVMARGLESIDEMAARMNALIGQLLEATRLPSARALVLHRELADLTVLAREVVTDHGLGIPQQELPSVFDAFYRGQRVTDSVPGTGLGLAIVRRIVDQHGGQVVITSEEGRGTSVVIRLPICDD